VERSGNAKIGDDGNAAGHHDVLGLDIPMDDAVLVRVLQRAADFASDLEGGCDWKLLFAREELAEGLAFDERHDVVKEGARRHLPRVEKRKNVRVL